MLQDNEKWCVGFEGHYAVTSGGEVISYKRGNRKVLKSSLTKVGKKVYRQVNLNLNGKVCGKTRIHQLVAEAFIPEYDDTYFVLKKNEDGGDGLDNIYICKKDDKAGRRGFTDKQSLIDLIHTGDTKKLKYKSSADNFLNDKSIWEEAGVPEGIKNIMFRHGSYLNNWNYIITLLDEVLNTNTKLEVLALMFNCDQSLPSHIRAGRRWTKEVELYKEYRNTSEYLKFYKPTYSVK